eukprot:scaffold17452_cov27-Tisochrysis_lutea.AAC.1
MEDRTITWIGPTGSLPRATNAGLVATIRGSSHRVSAVRKMSASTSAASTSGGSVAIGTTATAEVGYNCRSGTVSYSSSGISQSALIQSTIGCEEEGEAAASTQLCSERSRAHRASGAAKLEHERAVGLRPERKEVGRDGHGQLGGD